MFKDHFSTVAQDYSTYRPHYPEALFQHLARSVPQHALAWDAGTGNGQAAVALAGQFDAVVATDASAEQIAAAAPHPRVRYSVSPAERVDLPDASVDLVTVATAVHWFPLEAFYAEVARVLKPGGIIAVWSYWWSSVTPEVDRVVARFQAEVAPYWPPERDLVDERYTKLLFPFHEEEVPTLQATAAWTATHFMGYLRTWSAVRAYTKQHGTDPLAAFSDGIHAAWGEGPRDVRWPLVMRIGRR
jgi:ubiquinone/menaquinone biosynthesis C-methylase UbiE